VSAKRKAQPKGWRKSKGLTATESGKKTLQGHGMIKKNQERRVSHSKRGKTRRHKKANNPCAD